MSGGKGWWGTRPERGTIGQPRSALNLRLLLALFGLVLCTALAVLSFRERITFAGWAFALLAVIALVDLIVIQLRRIQRRRHAGRSGSLFE